MFDLRGAVLREDPRAKGFFLLEEQGYIHPAYLDLVPGVTLWDYGKSWRIPENLLPSQIDPVLEQPAVCPYSGLVLRSYQNEALGALRASSWCGMTCLDVGLGKTAVALMAHHLAGTQHDRRPFLIVGPLVSSAAWVGDKADPAVHFGYRVVMLRTRDPEKFMREHHGVEGADGYFINFELLVAWQLQLQSWGCRTVIVDESHMLRGGKTQAAKVFSGIVRAPGVKTRIALTATPIVSKVADLHAQLDFIAPDGFGWWTQFVTRYSGAYANEFTKYALGDETNVLELRQRLSRTLFRRSRFDVREELPAFERQLAPLDIDVLDETLVARYKDIEEDFVASVEEDGGRVDYQGLALQQITRMATILAEAKRPFAAIEALNMARANGAVVVFTWYKETAAYIAAMLSEKDVNVYGPITSKTTKLRRDKAAEAFKRRATAVATERRRGADAIAPTAFVATLGTAGMSMNQLAASPCGLMTELYWLPATLLQGEGRIYRSNQLSESCFVRYLIVRNTMDEILFSHLKRKARVISNIINDGEAVSLCESLGGPDATAKNDFASLCAALMGVDGTGEIE